MEGLERQSGSERKQNSVPGWCYITNHPGTLYNVSPLRHKEISITIITLNCKQDFISLHPTMWSWQEWNLPFSIFKILSAHQDTVQIANPFWSFPWLNKSTKHNTGARERGRRFFKLQSAPLGPDRICYFT